MLVSIALFAIVMVVCVGALLSLVGANKKAQALESVMNNLNISLDDMARSIREGTNYDGTGKIYNGTVGCTSNSGGGLNDCTGGTQVFKFAPYGVDTNLILQRSMNGFRTARQDAQQRTLPITADVLCDRKTED